MFTVTSRDKHLSITHTATKITGLPTLNQSSLIATAITHKTHTIVHDTEPPLHCHFNLPTLDRRYTTPKSRRALFRKSFVPSAIQKLNKSHHRSRINFSSISQLNVLPISIFAVNVWFNVFMFSLPNNFLTEDNKPSIYPSTYLSKIKLEVKWNVMKWMKCNMQAIYSKSNNYNLIINHDAVQSSAACRV